MGLINLRTDLKSLRYGKDTIGGGSSREPYITTSINSTPGNTGGPDFTLRANTLQHVGRDTQRLTKFMFSPKGLQFTAKQNLLSRTGVKTQASGIINEGAYLPTSTILQAAGNPFGTHLLKQGLNPSRNTSPNVSTTNTILDDLTNLSNPPLGVPVYTSDIENIKSKENNRLLSLKKSKISSPSQTETSGVFGDLFGEGLNNLGNILRNNLPFGQKVKDISDQLFSNTTGISKYKGEILRYGGGPGSILGVGQTSIKRTTYSDEGLDFSLDKNKIFKGKFYVLDSNQIANQRSSKDTIEISDFRIPLLKQQKSFDKLGKKNILSKSLNYNNPANRIEGRVNLGDPGRRGKNVSSYQDGLGALDQINALPLYKSTNVTTNAVKNDLVNFRFGVIDNKQLDKKTFIHFRAFIDSFSDNYSATWNSEQYMGRGEKFYRYGGFDRQINLSWTVAAQSKEELMIMYKKLNYLASTLAPDYTDAGYMAGNLVTLTLGGWCYEQPGFITSINLDVPNDSPWEISIPDGKGTDNNVTDQSISNDKDVKEMPHIIKVSGFTFTPIHNFAPRIQNNTFDKNGGIEKYGDERFIALENDSKTNQYTDFKEFFNPSSTSTKHSNKPQDTINDLAFNYNSRLSESTQGINNGIV